MNSHHLDQHVSPYRLKEIYPGEKTQHFRSLHEKSGLAYEDMLFFDDAKVKFKSLCAVMIVIFIPCGT